MKCPYHFLKKIYLCEKIVCMLNYIVWNFEPRIFPNSNLYIAWYGVCFALGVYLCYLIVSYAWKKEGKSENDLNKVVIWLLVALIVGARLGHCLFYEPDYYLSNPLEILKTWKGGLASHGAAIALPITVYILSRKYDFNWVWFLDRLAIGVALAGSFIRLGNFFNSEIYGVETTLPWGVIFVRNGETVPKHPTQLYESLAYLLIFVLLICLYQKKGTKLRTGFLSGLFLVLVFVFRFFIEFIKNPQVDFETNMVLNMGQLLSIPFILLGVYLLFFYKPKPAKEQIKKEEGGLK